MLIVPPIGWKVASGGGGGGYSFNMTAGNLGGALIGYYGALGLGSIDAEPIPGEILVGVLSVPFNSASQVAFAGDIVALLSGLDVWVGGVNMMGAAWAYDAGEDATVYVFGDGTEFEDGNTYFIEIK